MTDLKEKTEEIKEDAEHLAHNVAHPEDETRKEARRRQKKMPIIGAAIAALILFAILAYFLK